MVSRVPETWARGLELLRYPHHRRAAASPKTFSRVISDRSISRKAAMDLDLGQIGVLSL